MSLFSVPKEPDPPKVVLLDDRYSRAIIGHNVSVHDPPRLVYSLVLLTDLMRKLDHKNGGKLTEEQTMERVASMVRKVTKDHGASAPVFVDDSQSRISRTPAKEKPKNRIITRGGHR